MKRYDTILFETIPIPVLVALYATMIREKEQSYWRHKTKCHKHQMLILPKFTNRGKNFPSWTFTILSQFSLTNTTPDNTRLSNVKPESNDTTLLFKALVVWDITEYRTDLNIFGHYHLGLLSLIYRKLQYCWYI